MIKTMIFVLAFLISLSPSISFAAKENPEKMILGHSESQWKQDLGKLEGYEFEEDFLDKIMQNEKDLITKRSATHFEILGDENPEVRKPKSKNPLFQTKNNRHIRSKFITSLKLDDADYTSLLNYIPKLREYYSSNHVSELLPYFALCLNYGVSKSDLQDLVYGFVKKEMPVEVVEQRLERMAEIAEQH